MYFFVFIAVYVVVTADKYGDSNLDWFVYIVKYLI